jgi:putative transposase
MTELKNRGVEDILIAVVDGLKGFPEAIAGVFPPTIVQTCIVHLIRNSMDFASWKDRKPIAAELKAIYRATDADVARRALEDFDAGVWGRKYPAIAQSWRRNWEHVIPFFAFPVAVRRIIYTTDEIDKRNLRWRVIYDARERPRDEARRVGCKRRQASYSFLAGLRRSRAPSFGGCVLQRSTKRA